MTGSLSRPAEEAEFGACRHPTRTSIKDTMSDHNDARTNAGIAWTGRLFEAALRAKAALAPGDTVDRALHGWDGKVGAKAWVGRVYAAAERDPTCIAAGYWRREGRSGLWTTIVAPAEAALGTAEMAPDTLAILSSAVAIRRPGGRPEPLPGWGLIFPLDGLMTMAQRTPRPIEALTDEVTIDMLFAALLALPVGGSVPVNDREMRDGRLLAMPELEGVAGFELAVGGGTDAADFGAFRRGASRGSVRGVIGMVRGFQATAALSSAELAIARQAEALRARWDETDVVARACCLAGAFTVTEAPPVRIADAAMRRFPWGAAASSAQPSPGAPLH
jgi:hypothetical protein